MVKVSVIASKKDNISNSDIEIVETIVSSAADYVYFKNDNDDLYPDLLIEAYNRAVDKDLDYVVLNRKGVKAKEIGTYELDDFESDIFKTDFKITSKLIRKSIIKDDFDENINLLNIDVILSAGKFSFLDEDPVIEVDHMDNVDDAIRTINNITLKLMDYKKYNGLKDGLYNYKLERLLHFYEKTPEDEKEDIYWKLKEDFTKIIYHPHYVDFTVGITILNKMFFDYIVYSEDFKEFKESIPYYYIKSDVFKLKDEIIEIKNENRKIKQETSRLNKMNKDIMNSRSWSMTKPLRDIKKSM